jgi:two-component system CheB/CheR fusion protein
VNSETSPDIAVAKSHTLPEAPTGLERRTNLDFVVVGIGASAGGVEALSAFFGAMPSDTGMAFVVIQHLPPDNQSLMPEILSRCTSMPVAQIEDGVRVEPNSVYVIRPGFTVTLSEGVLRLGQPVEKRGHRRPVDDFFRSLALEQKETAIAVVLSGTGTNGAAGAQAIKAAGGLCIAQEPENAEFPGMPQSLIRSGYADQVLPADAIPGFLVEFVKHPFMDRPPDEAGAAMAEEQSNRNLMGEIHALLRTRTGHDFRGYRKATLLRRILRRMGVAGVTELAQYAKVVREQPNEAQSLANDLMINVTGFFRDPEAWEALRAAVIVPLVEARLPGDLLRAWVAACSSGEEAYSLAMLIAEECHRVDKRLEVKVFATDTADRSLALARAGIYPGGIEGDISFERLDRFFDKDEHTYRIKKEIRDMVIFAPQDLLRDPPFSRVDLATCRNLLIYLEPETQRRVVSLLSFAVRDGGYLFLGNTESAGDAERSFELVSKRWRIYRRVGSLQHRPDIPLSARLAPPDGGKPGGAPLSPVRGDHLPIHYERALLEAFAPPTVVVDRREQILYIHGELSPFLTYPAGEFSTSIVEMARPALRAALRTAFRQALETVSPAAVDSILEADRGTARVRITVAPLASDPGGRNLRVTFERRPQPQRSANEGAETSSAAAPLVLPSENGLEDEVRILRQELRASVEAFEASNEELKASNEEVLSINEELETSKEELQSINEELTTVNTQLQVKILELEQTNNDVSNLLSSTSIAVVFLDTQLLVRRYTPAVQDLLELIPTDIGRPIRDLAPKFATAHGLESPHEILRRSARAVLDSLMPSETEVRSDSGKWYLQRTLPYRTSDNRIAGVVLTFVDITRRKLAERSLAEMQARLEAALEHMPAAVIIVDAQTARVLHANRQAAALFGQPFPPPFLNASWHAAVGALKGWHPDGREIRAEEWPLARSLASGMSVVGEQVEINAATGNHRVLSVSSAPVTDEAGEVIAAVAAFWDITELKSTEKALRESERQLRLIVESAQDFAILMTDRTGNITSWNTGAARMLGWTEAEMLGQPAAAIFTPADQDAGVPEREMRTALQRGHAPDERWHIRKDGTAVWVNGALSVARDDANGVQGFVKIMRDDTSRKEAEDQLYALTQAANEAKAKAEAANRAKDDFISMVSHELRTPLHTMRLWMRLLNNEALPKKEGLESKQILERAIDAQQQLIDDLLDISRISAGKLRLDKRLTRLAESIGAAIEAVQPVSERKNVHIRYRASPEVGVVRADPDRMQQVVWNLLSNAVKFTPSGGEVRVDVDREPGGVVIKVADTGIGIQPDLLPHIFDRFLQGESGTARQHTGLGLGLAIAKELVELHGGSISALSEGSGKGASFIVRLPLKAESLGADFAHSSGAAAAVTLDGLRILLVEDEGTTREATRHLLEDARARVQAVESTPAAREAYSIQRPDIIISDIGMPGEDGYVLMQQIRTLERQQGISRVPSVALTAFARVEDRERALEAGYDTHIAKPVDPEHLFHEIARVTGRSRH